MSLRDFLEFIFKSDSHSIFKLNSQISHKNSLYYSQSSFLYKLFCNCDTFEAQFSKKITFQKLTASKFVWYRFRFCYMFSVTSRKAILYSDRSVQKSLLQVFPKHPPPKQTLSSTQTSNIRQTSKHYFHSLDYKIDNLDSQQ